MFQKQRVGLHGTLVMAILWSSILLSLVGLVRINGEFIDPVRNTYFSTDIQGRSDEPITNGAGNRVSSTDTAVIPRIHGMNIVWLDANGSGGNGEKDLFMYGMGSQQTVEITNTVAIRSELDINDDGAVFVEDDQRIRLFAPEEMTIDDVPIKLEPFPNHPPTVQTCNIEDGSISFIATENNDRTDPVNEDPDAFVYNTYNRSTTRYSDLTMTRRHGGQWDAVTDGHYMVFSNNGTAHISEVATTDLTTGIVNYIRLEGGNPDRSLFGPYDMDDGLVVFEDDATQDIAYFDARTSEFYTIPHPGIDKDPSIQGGRIVWKTLDDSGVKERFDIFVYDIASKVLAKVTTNEYNDIHPDIFGNDVVCSSNRDGDWAIYLYNISDLYFNSAPVMYSLLASADTLPPEGSCTLTASAKDNDGDPLTYIWGSSGGNISGQGATVIWVAPSTEGDFTISCQTTDGTLDSNKVDLTISVRSDAPIGEPPIIYDVLIDPSTVEPMGIADISVTASDPDGDSLKYDYKADGGTFEPTGGLTPSSSVSWIAPQDEGSYVITVRAYDGISYSEPASATVSVSKDPASDENHPPTIRSVELDPERVPVGGECSIAVNAIDRDDDELTYSYMFGSDQIKGSGSSVTFIAPLFEGTFEIHISVSDGKGGQDSSNVDVIVYDPNDPPKIVNVRSVPDTASNDGYAKVLIMVQVEDPDGPEDIVDVKLDAWKMGLRSTIYILDDGRYGDERSDDGIFSYNFSIPEGTVPGEYELQITVTDSWGSTDESVLTLGIEEGSDTRSTGSNDTFVPSFFSIIMISIIAIFFIALLITLSVTIGRRYV